MLTNNLHGFCIGTGTIMWLTEWQRRNPKGYGNATTQKCVTLRFRWYHVLFYFTKTGFSMYNTCVLRDQGLYWRAWVWTSEQNIFYATRCLLLASFTQMRQVINQHNINHYSVIINFDKLLIWQWIIVGVGVWVCVWWDTEASFLNCTDMDNFAFAKICQMHLYLATAMPAKLWWLLKKMDAAI